MSEIMDPAVVLVSALIAEEAMVRRERDEVTRAAMRLEADLLEAHGTITTLEDRLIEVERALADAVGACNYLEDQLSDAKRELAARNAAADVTGPIGKPT